MFSHSVHGILRLLTRLKRRGTGIMSADQALAPSPLRLPSFVQAIDSTRPLMLGASDRPRVSIVIPVHNHALYSYNCLLALSACDRHIPQQIIIVDNASSDQTAELLRGLRGDVEVIRNTRNEGFVGACNRAAELARGEFIVFLNNDTQVTPGWLDHLLTVVDDDRVNGGNGQVGIAGSKLVYPDGRLQEAGGIIFDDASGWNYGRDSDPRDPRYDYNRPVDYCSGACLLVRTSLWRQLGGFDTRYAPAYYEDTDLCFAARTAGYRVMYCADSVVVHHEGVTAGTDTAAGHKAFQVRNHRLFADKWRDELRTQLPPPPACSPDDAARRLMAEQPAGTAGA